MDTEFCEQFNQLHAQLRDRFRNPHLSVDTIVSAILTSALAQANQDAGPLEESVAAILNQQIAAKVR